MRMRLNSRQLRVVQLTSAAKIGTCQPMDLRDVSPPPLVHGSGRGAKATGMEKYLPRSVYKAWRTADRLQPNGCHRATVSPSRCDIASGSAAPLSEAAWSSTRPSLVKRNMAEPRGSVVVTPGSATQPKLSEALGFCAPLPPQP